MSIETKIEFYKNRTLGERFSAAIDFLKQNWKPLYKTTLIFGISCALVMGLAIQFYFQSLTSLMNNETSGFFSYLFFFLLASWIFNALLLSSMGAFMIKYQRDELGENNSLIDFSLIFPLTWKTLWLGFLSTLVIGVICVVIGFLVASLKFGGVILGVFLMLFLLAAIVALLPSMVLIIFPMYFKGVSVWQSIVEAFHLGFKNWGSIFLSVLLVSIVTGIISTLFSLPYQTMIIIASIDNTNPFDFVGVWSFLFTFLAALGNVLIMPVGFVFFAFQYFSVTEKEDGISLQNRLDDFDNL